MWLFGANNPESNGHKILRNGLKSLRSRIIRNMALASRLFRFVAD